ncbi:MAG: hypothetical protein Sapg2KO_51930 [Saprospiraceae bacterium]
MRRFYDLHTALKQPLAVEALYLDRTRLKELPKRILAFKNLRLLNLSSNELEQFPSWLAQFSNLEILQVNNNRLSELPETLSQCSALQILDLRQNQLQEINASKLPPNLIQLDLSENHLRQFNLQLPFLSLQSLLLNQNKLTSFPKLKNAPQLKTLALSQNKIKKGPKDWSTIKSIEQLNLGRNRLVNIPDGIAHLEQLKYLDLSRNKLRQLPAAVAKCTHLRKLNLAANQLPQLPAALSVLEWLIDLDLSKNTFKEIPESVQKMRRLDRLDLSRNHLASNLDFQSPQTLRVLNLSHNPLKTIAGLPPQLKQLSLRKTALKKTSFLGSIKQLEELDLSLTPLEKVPKELFLLSQLKKLKGLLAPTPKKHLLQLLQSPLSATEIKELYFFWEEAVIPSQAILLKGLCLSLTTLSKKIIAQLLQETQEVHENLPETVKAITLLGHLGSSKTSINEGFKKADIGHSVDSPWVIIGKGPYPKLSTDKKRYFFNEAQLLAFISQKSQKDFIPFSQSQTLKLERLLLHPNPRQVKMALLLLKTQQVETHLLPALITAWKLQTDPKLKRQLNTLVQQNQHPAYESLRNSRLPFSIQQTPDNKGQLILKWLEKEGLESDQFQHWKNYF